MAVLSCNYVEGTSAGPCLIGPLVAIEGEPLTFYCVALSGEAGNLVLQEGGVSVMNRIEANLINITHKQYTLNSTRREDNGRVFTCALAQNRAQNTSVPATVTILSKIASINMWVLASCTVHLWLPLLHAADDS